MKSPLQSSGHFEFKKNIALFLKLKLTQLNLKFRFS